MKKVVPLTARLRYRGVFPVVPTVFTADGRLDLDGQKCCVDFVIDVIVTTSHFSSQITADRSQHAQALGAAMVMVMPPYHGATICAPEARWSNTSRACRTRSRSRS